MDIPSKKIQIPKQIIANGMIQNLNSDYIEANLAELQYGIITNNIPYDHRASFGLDSANDNNKEVIKYEAEKIQEILREGRWKLTPDKKSIYYTFLTQEGHYLPLMADNAQILKFDLLDLNNPQSLERQKQRLLEAIGKSSLDSE